MLEATHSVVLVAAAVAVSLLAAFTGLSLTRGLSRRAPAARKPIIAMSAIALGGGIWSMHFIAMLGLRLPIPVVYDPLVTLMSAMVAILVAGLALLILHFRDRTPASRTMAGALLGLGVAAMHYLGMSGMELCRPVYTPIGVAAPLLTSVGLGVLAIRIAYQDRSTSNILFGTVVFGLAVCAVHFLAMANTGFLQVPGSTAAAPMLDQGWLALIVMLAAFVICGAFLLTAATFLAPAQAAPQTMEPEPLPWTGPAPDPAAPTPIARVPYERHGRTEFVACQAISAIRAEGHYSILYADSQKLFCPWSISKARVRLTGCGFEQVHRSYLVNPRHVTGFERRKDSGVCYFENTPALDRVPVSRARLGDVRARLGL